MHPLRILSLSLLLAWCQPAAAAVPAMCADACRQRIAEARVFEGQGNYQEALERYRLAGKADPQASVPLSLSAALLYKLSTKVAPDQAGALRDRARALATGAAALAPDDPIAQEALRLLDDDGPSPLRAVAPQAANLLAEAEAFFVQRKLRHALDKYEAVMKLDPQFSGAWVGAGDCHFLWQEWPQAEALFRRATEIEPRNSQAWRFLADTLLAQGKRDAAVAALLSAISADPSQRPNWSKLADLRAAAGTPLARLGLRRGVRVTQGADGKFTVGIDEDLAKQQETPDYAIRVALGVVEANLRTQDTAGAKSAFQVERDAWAQALKIAGELKASTGTGVSDPALQRMQAFASDGQLEPAILLLLFRQSYRPALEAWVAANPGGVAAFIDRYGLRP